MKSPLFEVADIVRAHGDSCTQKNRSWLTWWHPRVLFAIEHCRTAALGGHLDRCGDVAMKPPPSTPPLEALPQVPDQRSQSWLAERSKEPLPVSYVHVVFTIPHELSWLALHKKKVVYDLLFRSSAGNSAGDCSRFQTSWRRDRLPECAAHLGSNLLHHPRIHCVIPSGGLSLDH
jgi:hypothetical protein